MRGSRPATEDQPNSGQPYAARPLPDATVFRLRRVHLKLGARHFDPLDILEQGVSPDDDGNDGRSLAEFFDLTSPEPDILPAPAPEPVPEPECAVKPNGSLRGQLILVRRDRIEGWALDGEGAVELAVMDNRRVIGHVHTGHYERMPAGCEGIDERYVFSFMIPGGLAPDIRHLIEVVRAKDFCELPGSPRILEKE